MESDDSVSVCLVSGTTVLMTCLTLGYPRPELVFTKATAIIIPGVGVFEGISQVRFDQVCHNVMYNMYVRRLIVDELHDITCTVGNNKTAPIIIIR